MKHTLHQNTSNLKKTTVLRKMCSLISGRWDQVHFAQNLPFLYIGYFIRMYGTSSLSQRQNPTCPECIHFWSVDKYFLILLMWTWINWKGLCRQDNIFEKFPSRNILLLSILQVTTCHSFISKIKQVLRLRCLAFSARIQEDYVLLFVAWLIHTTFLVKVGEFEYYPSLSGRWCMKSH